MKVVFLKDVKGVGRMYEEKEVSEGYAINFLLPKKLAVQAGGAAAAHIKHLKENDLKHKEADLKKLEEEVHKIANTDIEIVEKANEKGSLFATINKDKILRLLKDRGVVLSEANLVLDNGIKELGVHKIPIKIGDKLTHFNLSIKAK